MAPMTRLALCLALCLAPVASAQSADGFSFTAPGGWAPLPDDAFAAMRQQLESMPQTKSFVLQLVYRLKEQPERGGPLLLAYRMPGAPMPMTEEAMLGFQKGMLSSLIKQQIKGDEPKGRIVEHGDDGALAMRFETVTQQQGMAVHIVAMALRHERGTQLVIVMCPERVWAMHRNDVEQALSSVRVVPPLEDSAAYRAGIVVGTLLGLLLAIGGGLWLVRRGGRKTSGRRRRRRR